MQAVLVLALVAPVAGLAVTAAIPRAGDAAVRVSGLVAAGLWVALLADGSARAAGPFHSTPFTAAAACGAALVAAAVGPLSLRRPLPAAVALVAVTAAIAGGRSATNGPVLAAGVALAAGAAIAADWERDHSPVLPLVAAAGIGTLLVGLGILGQRTGSASLPPVGPAVDSYRVEGMVILLAAAALVVAGSLRPRAPVAVLVAGGAFVGSHAAPLVVGRDGAEVLAVLLAALAAVAAVGRGRALFDRPTLALGLLGLAASVAPGSSGPAALLLLAAAVLAAGIGVPPAIALGLPGGIALALALAAKGGATALIVGALAGAVAFGLAGTLRVRDLRRPTPWEGPLLAASAWLLIAPGSWAWVGAAGLRHYDLGAGRAAAAAALVVVVGSELLRRARPGRWYAHGTSPPASPIEDVVRH